MPYLLVRHGVRDYAHWRALFDGDAADQRAAGMQPPFDVHWLEK